MASIETDNRSLALLVAATNDATYTEAEGVYTVVADELVITLEVFGLAGGPRSYPDVAVGDLPAWSGLGSLIGDGYLVQHDHERFRISDDGPLEPVSYTASPQPSRTDASRRRATIGRGSVRYPIVRVIRTILR